MPNNRVKIYNDKVYYGASNTVSTPSGSQTVGFAGVWDGTLDGWSSLDGGIQAGYGRGIYVVNESKIYVFGKFSAIGINNPLTSGGDFNIAEWNGTSWQTIGGSTIGSTDDEIKDMIYDSNNDILYVVGEFTTIYGMSANRVAKYDYNTSSWSTLNDGLNMHTYSCTLDGDSNLYACGVFSGAINSGVTVSNTYGMAKWNVSTELWESIATGNNRTAWDIVWAEDTNHLYVCGSFSSIAGIANTKLLARYDLTNSIWESIGTFTNASDSTIYDIDYVGGGKLFVGGYFVSNGNDVAMYNGTSWTGHGLADGYGIQPSISAIGPIDLIVDGDDTIYINRNAGGFYIKKSGWSDWLRSDELGSNLSIVSRSVGIGNMVFLGSGFLYTFQELRDLGQSNGITDWDTMNIRSLARLLVRNGYVTQEDLNGRQGMYREWMLTQ